jgi:hypothetical protein
MKPAEEYTCDQLERELEKIEKLAVIAMALVLVIGTLGYVGLFL